LRLFDFQIDFVTHFDFYQVYDDMIRINLERNPRLTSKEVETLFRPLTKTAMILVKMSIQNIDFCKYLPSVVCLGAFVGAAKLMKKAKNHSGQEDLCGQVEREVD